MRQVRVPVVCLVALSVCSVARAAPADQALVDLEARWSKANVAKDVGFVGSVVAPEWVMQSGDARSNRDEMLANLKSGKLSFSAMTNHDVHARVYGDMAVVQGADRETSSYAGKDTSGEYTWTDVFQKRDGHWVAVASQVSKAP